MGDKIISIKNLGKTYKTGKMKNTALENVSLEISPGEFVAIIGASGSGKSTLLRQIGLLDKPTTGKYYLNNIDTSKIPQKYESLFRLRYLGYIFQEYALLEELNALQNIYLPYMMNGKNKNKAEYLARDLMKKVGLQGKEKNTKYQLSGGEQQRVAIARALINNPKILLADEPCANLDSKTSEQILQLLNRLNKEMNQTIVMVTHEQWHLKYVDRIIKLKDGNIIEDSKSSNNTTQ